MRHTPVTTRRSRRALRAVLDIGGPAREIPTSCGSVVLCSLLVDLALFVSTSDDAREPFDPFRPATLLPIVAGGFHALESQVHALDVRDLFGVLAAPYRERAQHEIPTPPPSR